MVLRRIFPGAGLGQGLHHGDVLEVRHGADVAPDQGDQVLDQDVLGHVHPGLEDHVAAGPLALERVGEADHGAFGDGRVLADHLFHGAGGEPVSGDVDDVVGAAHDEDVAVLVPVAGVAGGVVALERLEVGGNVAFVVAPERGQGAGRQRQAQDDVAFRAGLDVPAGAVDDVEPEAGHRDAGRAGLDRQSVEAAGVGADGPAGLRLPPVVDHRNTEDPGGPVEGVGVQPLAGREQGAQAGNVVLVQELAPQGRPCGWPAARWAR